MFIALGVNGGKYGDGLGILGVIIFCIAHVQIVILNVYVFLVRVTVLGLGSLEEDDRRRHCRIPGRVQYYSKASLKRFYVSIYYSSFYHQTLSFALRNSSSFFGSSLQSQYTCTHLVRVLESAVYLYCTVQIFCGWSQDINKSPQKTDHGEVTFLMRRVPFVEKGVYS